jgi:hypothetical protein
VSETLKEGDANVTAGLGSTLELKNCTFTESSINAGGLSSGPGCPGHGPRNTETASPLPLPGIHPTFLYTDIAGHCCHVPVDSFFSERHASAMALKHDGLKFKFACFA